MILSTSLQKLSSQHDQMSCLWSSCLYKKLRGPIDGSCPGVQQSTSYSFSLYGHTCCCERHIGSEKREVSHVSNDAYRFPGFAPFVRLWLFSAIASCGGGSRGPLGECLDGFSICAA